MESNIQQNTMKDLLSLINDKKIQQMMCNPDILNSMGQKPDINKLMNCQDLHNVVSDRNLMTQIMNLSKDMGGISSGFGKDMNMPDLSSMGGMTSPFGKDMNMPNLSSVDQKINQEKEMLFPDLSSQDNSNNEEKEMSLPDIDNSLSDMKLSDKPLTTNIEDNSNYEDQCQNLINMGFEDREENLKLLALHNGDIKKVLKVLL